MTLEQQIEKITCGLAKMVYSKYQVDRYGLKEGKHKYDQFEVKKMQLQKDLIDFGVPCERLRVIKVSKLPFLVLDDACTLNPDVNVSDIAFEYEQKIPSTVWTIVHNLHFNPNVTIIDDNGFTIDAVIQYLDNGVSLKAIFSIPLTGKAYLS